MTAMHHPSDAGGRGRAVSSMHRVVVAGGGFGGLNAVRRLRNAPVDITLIDRRNFHLFQPLLYQVATGGLSPANIAYPLRALFESSGNVRVLLAEVIGFDVSKRQVIWRGGQSDYDSLIVACGAEISYYGRDEWQGLAPGLKSIEDALDIRQRVFLAFEAAERSRDPAETLAWLTFVIVGGGPTGVELAGALGEIAKHTLAHEFRSINPGKARIILVEGFHGVLPDYPARLSKAAERHLRELGVTVLSKTLMTGIAPGSVTLTNGGQSQQLPARTVIWAAGVRASPIGNALAAAAGIEPERGGRLSVNPDLTIPGYPEIVVIGDMALCAGEDGKPLPAVAPVAVQQGRYAAALISARLHGRTLPPFRYCNRGSIAVIGRSRAVAVLLRRNLDGYPAWLAWLFVHLFSIVQFQNRLLVALQWAWSYFTWNRSARLITGESPLPERLLETLSNKERPVSAKTKIIRRQ